MIRFGDVTIDESSGEVERAGARVRLQEKSLQVLLALCDRPGEVVSREELVRRLWADANVHVDYTAGLNTAVNRLRVALGDSAESPRYVETIPKKGYRLIVVPTAQEAPPGRRRTGRLEAGAPKYAIIIAIAALVFTAGWWTIREGARTQRAVVAVLPFRDLSNPPAPRLADGITEEMITTLASIAPEQVGAIARTSAFRYRDGDRDLTEIGRELGVSYAMEGTVQAAGDRVRISARLVRIDARSVVWAESYDVDRRDLLTTERLVAEQVARAVHRRLTPRREPARPDPAAHERVMEARYLARRGSRDELQRAVALYLDAVQREPGYAEAHAGLANAYHALGDIPRARDAAQRAIELDPGSADAHHRLAVIHLYDDRDLPAARREFEAAVQANDGLEVVHHSYAAYFSILGQHDRAMEQIARARLIDPVSTTLNADACWYLYVARRYADAVAQCRHALALDPDHAGAHSYLVSSYLALGDSARALEHANALAGRAFPDLRSYWQWRRDKGGTSDNLALTHLALGDRERALQSLEQSHREKRGWLIPFMNVYPALDPLRDEPRFRALQRPETMNTRPD